MIKKRFQKITGTGTNKNILIGQKNLPNYRITVTVLLLLSYAITISVFDPDGSGFFADLDPDCKNPDPSINKLMGSK